MKLFRKISNLTRFLFPTKNLKLKYKDFCAYLDLRSDIKTAQSNYLKVIERLKNTNSKIKVLFLIRENQKWTYQSVYDEFLKSEKFEPLVAVSLLELARCGKDTTRNNIEENYNFFKSRGMNVDYALSNGEYVDLKKFNPDIVFYDQPWDLPEIHQPLYVSNYALTCYCPYGFELLEKNEAYIQEFHAFLFRYFVEHDLNVQRYKSYNKNNVLNCFVSGYPKLDEEIFEEGNSFFKDKNKFKVIYAPHHSFEKKGINIATFQNNYDFILELAKNNPQTEWIFRPHPRFKYAVLRNKIMSEDEIEKYYSKWKEIGSVVENGDCSNMFKESDLMITDCCSFLAEYLKSLKPLIRLVNPKGVKLNPIGKKIESVYYPVFNNSELLNTFNKLAIKGIDDKLNNRVALKNELFPAEQKSGSKIYKHIESIVGNRG